MRVLVCGGRNLTDFAHLKRTLDAVHHDTPISVLIHGGARGADTLARRWGEGKGIPIIEMKANWDFYKKGAGPVRNAWMLKHATPDLVIAFAGQNGTEDMKTKARAAGIEVWTF